MELMREQIDIVCQQYAIKTKNMLQEQAKYTWIKVERSKFSVSYWQKINRNLKPKTKQ